MPQPQIRRANAADIPELARLHIASWRESYAGWMPDEVLANLDPEDWEERWRAQMAAADQDPAHAVFLALDETGAPAGFGACRRQTSQKLLPLGFDGEVASLYLLRKIQGQGVGPRLIARMATHLVAHECRACGFWVFRNNAGARRFYERLGAAPTGIEGVWEIFGMVLPDIAYGWKDLRPLAMRDTGPLPSSGATR
jgi:ribosomal protein S18 acetylase RimI-like enzyme